MALEKLNIYHVQIIYLEVKHAVDSVILLISTIIFPSLLFWTNQMHRGVLSTIQVYLKYNCFF